ncbi:MAG: ABC transporter permease [Opitutaceae bacterium]|nr:ABC transporter permease [Opitutaceae bacterium]
MIDTFLQDLRVGLRVLIKEKSFCFLAVTVLALGICGVTTQFTIVNAVVLRGFSFPESGRLMGAQFIDPSQFNPNNNFGGGIPGEDFQEILASQQSFSGLAAYIFGSTVNVTINGNAQRYTGCYSNYNFFRILGVAPVLGRDFSADDDKPGAERVTIIGHGIWQTEFNSDPNVLGRTMRLNGRTATIIGVMPPRFQFPSTDQLWVPLYNEFPIRPRNDPAAISPLVLGRLKPGVTIDQANVEFNTIAQRLAKEYPATNRQLSGALVQPLHSALIGPPLRGLMFVMLAAVLAVLVIACVNVMNMQFARATLRAKELAIRGALGATRVRLVRQMLTESLLIAVMGAVVGIAGSYWAVEYLYQAMQGLPFPLPYWITFDIDGPVLTFTVAATMGAALLSGLVPAMLASRANAAEVLKEAGRGNTSRLVNAIIKLLVIGQIALSAALLIAASLQIKSILNQQFVNYGYDENSFLTARLGLFEGDYPTPESRQLFFERTLRELRAGSEFAAVALTGRFRMTFGGAGRYEVDGQAYATDKDRPEGNFENISDGYFATIGLKIMEGRDFRPDDTEAKQPVAIVNASFAKKHFGRETPIGRRVRIYNPAQPEAWRTIIGVVPDTLMQGPINPLVDDCAGFYQPLSAPPALQFATVLVRPRAGQRAENLAPTLRRAMTQLDPNLPLYFVGTPRLLHDEILGQNRIVAALFSAFGGVAVVLAAVGLYGVMSFSVNQRTQEFGIRMALGADALKIMRMVLRQGGMQLGIGLPIGVVTAYALALLGRSNIQNFLFRVDPRDPFIYGSVILLLTTIAAVSCYVPARRATRVDPMIALRAE